MTSSVLPNGVDLDHFRPTGTHADLDGLAGLSPASAGTVRVGLVATYARWKGHETFIRALAQLAGRLPIRGYIVGSPVYRSTAAQVRDEELRALAQSMGVTAHLGFVPFQADPAPVYRALDVVVHASTSPEPFGLVVAEAMACGRAVVATTLGGVAEVADEEVASLHTAGDAGDLARAIGRCADDERTRASLGAAARARAEQRFSLVRFRPRPRQAASGSVAALGSYRVSRTSRFLGGLSFGYLHLVAVTIAGLWLTPFLLRHIGQHDLGLWLMITQVVNFLGLLDLGVITLLPRETAYVAGARPWASARISHRCWRACGGSSGCRCRS